MFNKRVLSPARFRLLKWCGILVLPLAFISWDTFERCRHILEITSTYGVTVDAPEIDPKSVTGYQGGRRSLALPEGAEDGAHWIMQTQTALETGVWRVRHVDYDNAPRGRKVHWGSPFRWWMEMLAWTNRILTGNPTGLCVEWAALISGPMMLGVALVGFTLLVSKKFSGLAAGLMALGSVVVYPFYSGFVAGFPDHHGAINFCCTFMVLFVLVGSFDGRRCWFVASGLFGGVGVWMSAATLTPVLIGLGLGALSMIWIARKSPKASPLVSNPGLFRIWGWR